METLTEIFSNTYFGKKIFLTGHTGFKGAWLLYWLHLLGADVKGYSLEPEGKDWLYNLVEGDNFCHSIIGDIRDKEKLEREILSFEPDYIFHLAAQPLVRLSYSFSSETFSTNVMGTAYVLEVLKKLEKPCICIVITTDKVYENKESIYPYRESDVLGGYDPYSASKACAEIVVASYRNSFFNKKEYSKHNKAIASARAGNVIGGGDWAQDRIIPDIIRALLKEETVTIRNPGAVRPWQHVLEPLAGYLLLGSRLHIDPLRYSDAFNFGPYPEDTFTVEELVKNVIKIWGKGSYSISNQENQAHETRILKLDISKAKNSLNWDPKLNSQKAVEMTTEWYKGFKESKNAISLIEQDIKYYTTYF